MAWAVELRGISKAFDITRNPALNLKVKLVGLWNPRYRERRERFWALQNVDLVVRQGEFLALIGPNGSGKSTLLRIMAGVFPPTRGEAFVHGRVAPMIELGVGFHPELTGRENIYLNTSLFRLSGRETDAIYQQILDFSDLGEFIDNPVKNYSTGMYARLGFSVAVHLSADILLVDEVLAVGDARFKQKCIQRMQELRARGCTIVFVSHDTDTVERLSDRACLLVKGTIEADGEPTKVTQRYRELLNVAPSG